MVSNNEIKKGLAVKRNKRHDIENQIECQKCGVENRSNANYCKNCGEKLVSIVENRVLNEKKEPKQKSDIWESKRRNNTEVVINLSENTHGLTPKKPWEGLIDNVKVKKSDKVSVKNKSNEIDISNLLNSIQKHNIEKEVKTFDESKSSHVNKIKTMNELINEIKSKENDDSSEKSKFKQNKIVLDDQSYDSILEHDIRSNTNKSMQIPEENSLKSNNDANQNQKFLIEKFSIMRSHDLDKAYEITFNLKYNGLRTMKALNVELIPFYGETQGEWLTGNYLEIPEGIKNGKSFYMDLKYVGSTVNNFSEITGFKVKLSAEYIDDILDPEEIIYTNIYKI